MVHRQRLILGFFALVALAAAADPLEGVFARIDASAKNFRYLTADLSRTDHTAIVNDDSRQSGTIKLVRAKTGQTRMLIDFRDPGAVTVSFDGHQGRRYLPKTKTLELYDVADKESRMIGEFLLLGFGVSSTELKNTYDVAYAGEEKLGAQPVSHIRLVPKSAETRKGMKQADLWIAESGLVAQQKILEPSGDYKLYVYSNVKQPSSIPDKELELNPKGATIQKIQR